MNRYTNNDLSAGLTKLDFAALKATANFAVGELLDSIRTDINRLNDALNNKDYTKAYLLAEYIAIDSKKLAISTDTYAALCESDGREIKIIGR
jgi:hypothetical protein